MDFLATRYSITHLSRFVKGFLKFFQFFLKRKRITGIEPVSSAWKADILAIILHPHSAKCQLTPNRSSCAIWKSVRTIQRTRGDSFRMPQTLWFHRYEGTENQTYNVPNGTWTHDILIKMEMRYQLRHGHGSASFTISGKKQEKPPPLYLFC